MPFYLERLDVRGGGGRIVLPEGTVSMGRSPKNTITLPAEDRCVSAIHAVVYVDSKRLLLQDMQSTNGTFVNGKQVQERVIGIGDEVRLGLSGPRFRVLGDDGADADAENISGGGDIDFRADDGTHYDIDDSQSGSDSPTVSEPPVVSGRLRVKIVAFTAAAIVVAAMIFGFSALFKKPADRLPDAKSFFTPPSADLSSSSQIVSYNDESPPESFTQISTSGATVDRINAVLARFGETDYRAPPEMVERVEHYIALNTKSRKRYIAATLSRGRQFFPMIHRVFSEKNVPLELAYVAMQESGFDTKAVSHAGAVGLWQFMPATARRYGLEVSSRVDERTDPEKSTYAAAAYFRHLIAIFGAKSSVMLSMAAYNAGEQRIINALKKIDDPVRNRDFWYLYRMGWLAEETNEYIPQIIALIIISENLEEYGFDY